MKTTSLKLPAELDEKLAALAEERKMSKSSLVREALASYMVGGEQSPGTSFLAYARDLAGCVEGPEDLSSNPDHFRDYGR
jgi:hypothetical protein